MPRQPVPALLLGCLLAGCAGPPIERPAAVPDRLVLRSDEGGLEVQFGGLLQTTLGVFDGDREPSSDMVLKRMRPEIDGRIGETLRFKLEPNVTEHEVELEEAWLGAELAEGRALLMVGRMKVPFNLEEVRSRRHIDFVSFSVLNQFAPAEDHGVFLNGTSASRTWEWGASLTNGTGESDTNASKDLAGRLMAHPFADEPDSRWRNLQIGLAMTVGREQEDADDVTIDNAAGLPVVRFVPGTELDGDRWRAGLEAAWFDGPWFLQGEWLVMRQRMSVGGVSPRGISYRGAYLTVARVLTGESKSFGGVSPEVHFDVVTGAGRGAWVAALRISQLSLDTDIVRAGLAVPTEFTDRIRSVSAGLNWIPNDHVILRNNLVYSRYADAVRIGDRLKDDELALLAELQFHF
jgi:phosphate-selective porin